jgi:hypothetical protein
MSAVITVSPWLLQEARNSDHPTMCFLAQYPEKSKVRVGPVELEELVSRSAYEGWFVDAYEPGDRARMRNWQRMYQRLTGRQKPEDAR